MIRLKDRYLAGRQERTDGRGIQNPGVGSTAENPGITVQPNLIMSPSILDKSYHFVESGKTRNFLRHNLIMLWKCDSSSAFH